MKLKFIIAAISALFSTALLPNGNRLAMLNTHGGHSMFIIVGLYSETGSYEK